MATPLKKARESRGESTYVVAAAVGVNQSQYSRVETGKRRPSPALAKRLSTYFEGEVTRDQIIFPEEYVAPGKKPSRSVR